LRYDSPNYYTCHRGARARESERRRVFKLYHYPAVGPLAFADLTEDTQGLSSERRGDAAGIPVEELVAGPKRAGKAKK
jgi:hypothetical protein